MSDDDPASSTDQLTSKSEVRWTYLGSIISFVVLIGFMAVVGAAAFGYADLANIDRGWFYLVWAVVLTATGWVFGTDIVKEYDNFKNGKQ